MVQALAHFAWQCVILAGMVGALLAVQALAGGWMVLAFLPARDALRWPVFAPIAGMAFFTAAGLPLALLGLPVSRFGPVLAIVGGVLTLASAWRLRTSDSGRRVLWAFLRLRGLQSAAVVAVVVVLSTFLIVGRIPVSVIGASGSGDYGAYWVAADYLRDHGATLSAYESQQVFNSSDVLDHLRKHARLGCMVYLSLVGVLLSPQAIHHLIIPSIVAAIILLLGLAQCWLDRERPGLPWLLALVIAHPLLYFLLYFSFASQAFGALLFVAGLLLADRAKGPLSRDVVACASLAGLMFGCAILHYPSMPIATAIFGMIAIARGVFRRQLAPVGIAAIATLVTCGYYLPATVREMQWASSTPQPPGWEWAGLIGPLEFLGFKTVLGYSLPEPRPRWMLYVYAVLVAMLFVLLLRGVRRSRLKAESLAIIASTALLASVALLKYFQHLTHSNHAFVKVISFFAPFLVLITLLPVADRLRRLPARPRRWAVAALISVFVIGQVNALRRREMLLPFYSDDLITLTRRQLQSAPSVHFGFWLPRELTAPLVRDMRRAVDREHLVTGSVEITDRHRLRPADSSLVVDHEGPYVALRRTTPP